MRNEPPERLVELLHVLLSRGFLFYWAFFSRLLEAFLELVDSASGI